MAGMFPVGRKTHECECCERHSAELKAVFEWRATYHTSETATTSLLGLILAITPLGHFFHFFMPSKQLNFSTTHGFCNNCFSQIRKRNSVSGFLKWACLMVIVLAIMILTATIVFSVLFVIKEPTKSMITWAVIGLVSGLVCLWAGLASSDKAVRWCLPEKLKPISKPPFELHQFHKLAT